MGVSSLCQWLSLSCHFLSSVLMQQHQTMLSSLPGLNCSSVLVPEVHFGMSRRKFSMSITSFGSLLPPQCRRRQTPIHPPVLPCARCSGPAFSESLFRFHTRCNRGCLLSSLMGTNSFVAGVKSHFISPPSSSKSRLSSSQNCL